MRKDTRNRLITEIGDGYYPLLKFEKYVMADGGTLQWESWTDNGYALVVTANWPTTCPTCATPITCATERTLHDAQSAMYTRIREHSRGQHTEQPRLCRDRNCPDRSTGTHEHRAPGQVQLRLPEQDTIISPENTKAQTTADDLDDLDDGTAAPLTPYRNVDKRGHYTKQGIADRAADRHQHTTNNQEATQ